jgi:hypothetical protein
MYNSQHLCVYYVRMGFKCVHTYVHTSIRTYKFIYILTYIHKYIHTCLNAWIHTCINHILTYTYMWHVYIAPQDSTDSALSVRTGWKVPSLWKPYCHCTRNMVCYDDFDLAVAPHQTWEAANPMVIALWYSYCTLSFQQGKWWSNMGGSWNGGTPNGSFIMESPTKMYDLGVPLF